MAADVDLSQLMAAYQAGRFDAFDEIHAHLAPVVRRYLIAKVRDGARADDLVQETFLQMHRARHTFDPALPLTPWAMAIARHVWLMDVRTRSRRPSSDVDVTAIDVPVAAEASRYAEQADLRRALAGLPAPQREAAVRHHVWGWSFREIAERAGIAETAAKLRSSRGMARLRERLRPRGEGEKPK